MMLPILISVSVTPGSYFFLRAGRRGDDECGKSSRKSKRSYEILGAALHVASSGAVTAFIGPFPRIFFAAG
jgi:hypothetical protein